MKITRRQLRQLIKEAIEDWDEAEYDRGYQDGLDGMPVAGDATVDYDAGYEDGQQDATLPEGRSYLNEDNRPWGSYAEKKDDYFSDTLVMSPNGDSVLVDGLETYTQDVPTQLEYVSGFPLRWVLSIRTANGQGVGNEDYKTTNQADYQRIPSC